MPIALTVPFPEKDHAKALGAKWNGNSKQWEVPDGVDIAPFHRWVPKTALAAIRTPTVASVQKGIRLVQLLAQVTETIEKHFREEWICVEIAEARIQHGHIHLQLVEQDSAGSILAKIKATMWANVANELVPRFKQATGAELAPGLKLLIRARIKFQPAHGLSLQILDIDPSYTLGDMAAKVAEIRRRLAAEGLINRQKSLPRPTDFFHVLVISPSGAAGLGDFRREADALTRLNVCTFVYAESRFQGEGAAGEIVLAVQASLKEQTRPFDAVVIIRGGGATTDLHWLNDYHLARTICECPIPIITGIGHERDETILDEVAAIRCDTPSKAIAFIARGIQETAQKGCMVFDQIQQRCQTLIAHQKNLCHTAWINITQHAPFVLAQQRKSIGHEMENLRTQALECIQKARNFTDQAHHYTQTAALSIQGQWQQGIRAYHAQITALIPQKLRTAQEKIVEMYKRVGQSGFLGVKRMHQQCDSLFHTLNPLCQKTINRVRERCESVFRETIAQGPQRTLHRGFAIIRNAQNEPVTTIQSAIKATKLSIELRDGLVQAKTINPAHHIIEEEVV